MDARSLDTALDRAFDADPAHRRVVVRQATDLAASGAIERDRGRALSVDMIVDNLGDAPNGLSLSARWNWWLGALEVAYGGYRQFQVTAVVDQPT